MSFLRQGMAALLLAAIAAPALPQAKQPDLPLLINPRVVTAMPAARPAATIHYGEAESQFAELFLPKHNAETPEAGLPVIVLIHGGCTLDDAGPELLRPAATAFIAKGYAVWLLSYRQPGTEGGGLPGSYADIGVAIDTLREQVEEHPLDLSRVILFGHGTGGHLALWAAGRHQLPETSALRGEQPLRPRGVVTAGALTGWPADEACAAARPADPDDPLLAETTPERLLPTGVETILLHGIFDPAAPPATGLAFAREARRAGDRSEVQIAPVADHYEVIAPNKPAFAQVRAAVERLLK